MAQIGWVLDHRWDLAADFRHLYHLSPAQALALPGPEYLALAWRTIALDGVMAARVAALQEKEKIGGQRPAETASDTASLAASPVFGELFD